MTLTVAVCAALIAAGTADAASGKKRAQRMASAPAAAAAPASGSTAMGMGAAMGGAAQVGQPGGEPFVLRHFDDIDTDKSGQLSREELTAWAGKMQLELRQRAAEHVKAADTNGDGQISLDEAKAGLPMLYDHFDFVDADSNGQVTAAELERLRDPDAMRTEILSRLRAADKDGNGKLDLNEVTVALPVLAAHFSRLDKDGDGFLTAADLAQLMGPR
jgi:Ca2+-binding EF-hand superfamily protein